MDPTKFLITPPDLYSLPTDKPEGGGGAFSDQRAQAQANRRRVDDAKMAGMNTARPVGGPPAAKAVPNRQASPDAISARNSLGKNARNSG